MKILSVDQIREADKFTIQHEPISSTNLMERASNKVAQWVLSKFSKEYEIALVCGTGNNGGDGLVVARLLYQYGYKINLFIPAYEKGKGSEDFLINLAKARELMSINYDKEISFPKKDHLVIIDALFGSGLSRPLSGMYESLVKSLNRAKAIKIAIDMPSGVYADKSSLGNSVFHADYTLTFQVPKLAFLFPENAIAVGKWQLLDIGLDSGFITKAVSDYHFIQMKDLNGLLAERTSFSHKGDYGRVTILAGSYGKMGAAQLALKACLEVGAGLITAQVPHHASHIIQTSLPEVMVQADEHEYSLGTYCNYASQDVLAVGPGIGTALKTRNLLVEILENFKGQLILDADALNILSEESSLLHLLPEGAILTPHPGEFKRMVGDWEDSFQMIALLKDFCKRYKVIVVLKGRYTAVCNVEGTVYFNSTGNPGMATGGSGDTLTGILTGLFHQVKDPLVTAQLGVFIHGLAGDLAAKQKGQHSTTPTDLIKLLNQALNLLIDR